MYYVVRSETYMTNKEFKRTWLLELKAGKNHTDHTITILYI